MPVDGYPGPGPYLIRALGWVGIGTFFYYAFSERGTRVMKDKYEAEGRTMDRDKQMQGIKLMMERLKDSPSNLSQVREQTTKERRKWATELEQESSSSEAQDKSDK